MFTWKFCSVFCRKKIPLYALLRESCAGYVKCAQKFIPQSKKWGISFSWQSQLAFLENQEPHSVFSRQRLYHNQPAFVRCWLQFKSLAMSRIVLCLQYAHQWPILQHLSQFLFWTLTFVFQKEQMSFGDWPSFGAQCQGCLGTGSKERVLYQQPTWRERILLGARDGCPWALNAEGRQRSWAGELADWSVPQLFTHV